ncbi:MAG: GMC family oxidoreductase [Mycobacterium sp.]
MDTDRSGLISADQSSNAILTGAAARPRSVVVIGAGTSGSVLAARLSQDPDLTVILLEAGEPDDYGDEICDPRRAPEVWSTLANATLTTMASPAGPIPMIQGHIIGGTSAVNYLATVRGQPEDYARWEAAGLPGWGWSDILGYFIAAETDLDFGPSPIHGDSGPLRVSRWTRSEHSVYQAAFADGMREVGIPKVGDVNDPAQLPGIGVFPATLDDRRRRMTTSTAYLTDDVRNRSNLVIRTAAVVSRVLVEQGRAVGVALDDGEEVCADEIVVAAGAIGSPTLLLRSGIGPRQQLADRAIKVHADLPVGSTMSDHLGTALTYQYDAPTVDNGGPAQTVLIGASNGKDVDYHVFPTPSLDPTVKSTFLLLTYILRSTGRGWVELDDDPAGAAVVTAPPLPEDVDVRLGHAFHQIAAWERSPAARAISCEPVEAYDLSAGTAVADALARITISYGHMVGNLPHGQRARRTVPCARYRRTAGCRRISVPGDTRREHLSRVRHDCRTDRRADGANRHPSDNSTLTKPRPDHAF